MQKLLFQVPFKTYLSKIGDAVDFYGIANVNVISDFIPIELIYDWNDPDPSKWKKECLNTGHHKTLIFRTENFGRMIVDFTAPQYGIIEYNVSDSSFPIWICKESMQEAYEVTELIFPEDIEATIATMIKEPSSFNTNHPSQPDFFPIAVLSYKNSLIDRIKTHISLDREKIIRPASAKKVPLNEAIENGWLK